MVYCHVKPDKLLKLRFNKIRVYQVQNVDDLLSNPQYRAMIELRQRMKKFKIDNDYEK
jgi:hypothetical protein